MKKNILKSMVALLMLWGTAACTDEVLVDMEKPGIENNSPEGGRITSLKNILPDAKPGYQGVDSRADNSWETDDKLLLKVEIKSDATTVAYTAWMTLVYYDDNENENVNPFWYIKEDAYFAQKTGSEVVPVYETLPLVTPKEGIILSGETANFDAIFPEEIKGKNMVVSMYYAPDLEWKENNNEVALRLKENPSTYAPEFWEVKVENGTSQWSTDLARVKVQVQSGDIVEGDVLALTAKNFVVSSYAVPYVEQLEEGTPEGQSAETAKEKTYLATSDDEGYAYFYGTLLSETTSDFSVGLKKVKIEQTVTDVFIPTTLFEASTLNKVTLEAGKSYLLDGTDGRTQALNDSRGAVITETNGKKTYEVYGVNGLLQWVADLNNADGVINFSMELTNDIVLPQFEIFTEGTASGKNLKYYYAFNKPITYDANGVPTNSNWISVSRGSRDENGNIVYYGLSGTIDGNDKVISGLRTNNSVGLVHTLEQNSEIKDLKFVNAIINNPGNAAVIVSLNKGKVTNCIVANSKVKGVGDVGAVVATNEGTVSGCHNVLTDVISSNNEFKDGSPKYKRASELVGGVVGQNVGDKSTAEDRTQGVVTDCTNSGKVISNGMAGNNFTGGIVGHSYGIVSYCTNTGYVESSTNGSGYNKTTKKDDGTTEISIDPLSGYYTSVGGVVGNCSFGRVIACMNEGKVKSGTTTSPDPTTHNRVGGVVGYSGTESHVVACGNTGNIEISGADKDHVGGIVGHLFHSYKDELPNSKAGQVYASWTKKVLEKGDTNATAGDGIGDIDDQDGVETTTGVFVTRVFDGKASVTQLIVDEMNSVIDNTEESTVDYYNKGLNLASNKYCSMIWSLTSGSWPTLELNTSSTNP